MTSVVVGGLGVALGKRSERLVVRGARPRLEMIEGGPQLFLAIDLSARPPLRVVTSDGVRTQAAPLRPKPVRSAEGAAPKARSAQVELPPFRVAEIIVAGPGVSISSGACVRAASRGAGPVLPAAPGPALQGADGIIRAWSPEDRTGAA